MTWRVLCAASAAHPESLALLAFGETLELGGPIGIAILEGVAGQPPVPVRASQPLRQR